MPERVRIHLELELGEPISGRLVDELGRERTFDGWLELNSAIQAVSQDVNRAPDLAWGHPTEWRRRSDDGVKSVRP